MTAASLAETLDEALAVFAAGVTEAASPFRNPTLASVDAAGRPQARTVVLRAFDAAARRLEVHADARSAKCAELIGQPAAALHVWDSERRLQVRLSGEARLHRGDAVAQAAWQSLAPQGQQLYRVEQQSGSVIEAPESVRPGAIGEAAGFGAFTVIAVRFDTVETLRLAGHAQIRARFTWRDDRLDAHWLVP